MLKEYPEATVKDLTNALDLVLRATGEATRRGLIDNSTSLQKARHQIIIQLNLITSGDKNPISGPEVIAAARNLLSELLATTGRKTSGKPLPKQAFRTMFPDGKTHTDRF